VGWYRKSAEQGVPIGQLALGAMYADGKGVPQDYVLAHMWFNLAAASGNENAVKGRDMVAAKMTPAQIAEAQKLAREWKPTPVPH
jgi:TPR repeat protein